VTSTASEPTTGRARRRLAALACLAAGLAVAGGAPAGAAGYTTEFVDVNTAGQKADGTVSRFPSVSETALIVAFDSRGTNLVNGDTNGLQDVFVRYRGVPMTVRASVSSTGTQANGASGRPSLDSWAERVAFESTASNLVSGDTNGFQDIFVRNLYSPASTARVSVSSTGAEANGNSASASISKGDARYVAFTSLASNLVPGDTNGAGDIFVRDVVGGTTTRVSVSSTGAEGNALSSQPSISASGRYVAFTSAASNLVPDDTNGVSDVFVRDLVEGTTTRVSVSSTGVQASGASDSPSVDQSGILVAFASQASNLVTGDTNQVTDVFVHQRTYDTTVRASVSSTGVQGDQASFSPSMGDAVGVGGIVAFASSATNLVSGDTNLIPDVFRRDTSSGQTDRWSVASDGSQATLGTGSGQPAMTHSGQAVAFVSDASNLAPGDGVLSQDVFLRHP
jgi:hypothetical protein